MGDDRMKGDVRTECAATIRRFEPCDFSAVLEIDRSAGGKHEPYLFTHFYENYPTTFMVAEVGGRLAGLIMGFKQSPLDGRVFWLAVRPGFEGRGIGQRLMIELLNKFRQLGTMRVILEVRIGNRRAQDLYRDLRFEAAAACPDYYPDGEGAIIMIRML